MTRAAYATALVDTAKQAALRLQREDTVGRMEDAYWSVKHIGWAHGAGCSMAGVAWPVWDVRGWIECSLSSVGEGRVVGSVGRMTDVVNARDERRDAADASPRGRRRTHLRGGDVLA